MPQFDKKKFVDYLNKHTTGLYGEGKCATHVRKAIEAAGLNPVGHPIDAKDWGPTLIRLGFTIISNDNYTPMLGDIAVIQQTSTSKPGHIEGYDGTHWVSDFVQPQGFWPGPIYRLEKPSYAIYRWNL
ncbi:MAG: hypothetical protein PW843_15730 [Azospirillaceae bacterium]|nr:hypothetical protein [Azospirillaceae bacterium]